MTMSVLRLSLLLLSIACYVSCYRGQGSRGGSYSLPKIGNYPSPTVFNPRNQGLPPVYHGKFKRSIDEELSAQDGGVYAAQDPAEYAVFKRSVDEEQGLEDGGVLALEETQPFEALRARRSPQVIIRPTYRPPPRRPQKPIWV